MKRSAAYALGLGLTAGFLSFAALATTAGECEFSSYELSDGKVEVEVLNRGTEPQLATAWFKPNYQYAGLGASSDRRPRTVSASGVVEPGSRESLVIEGKGLMSRLNEPQTVSLSCSPKSE